MRTIIEIILVYILFVPLAEAESDKLKLIYSLASYIHSNYHTAVENGKIISELEYDEMVRFSQSIAEIIQALRGKNLKNFDPAVRTSELLHRKIIEKAEAQEIKILAKELMNFSVVNGGLTLTHLPDFAEGERIYKSMCLVCHGERGEGKTGVVQEEAVPSITGASPAHVFLTTMFGVEGTPMRSFELQDKQRWSLSFYVSSLKYSHKDQEKEKLSGVEIQKVLESIHMNNDEIERIYGSDLAREIRRSIFNIGHIEFFKKAVEESSELVKNSEFEKAENLLSAAYLSFEEIEPNLKIKNPSDVTFVEMTVQKLLREISELRNTNKKDIGEVEFLKKLLLSRLDKIESQREYGQEFSAFIVVFREGAEAILIIAAILGVVSAVGITPIPVYLGGIFGAVFGVILWELTGKIIKINQEIMEGVITLFAVLVIVWVSFWVLEKVRLGRLKAFMESVKAAAHGRRYVWLFLISFLAASRETGEAVLFLRALGGGRIGIMLGFISLAFVAIAVYFLKLKLPIRGFFLITNILLNVLAVILIGKAVEEFQEAGVIPITFIDLSPLGYPRIYTTLQKILPQFVLFAVLFGATAIGIFNNLRTSRITAESKLT